MSAAQLKTEIANLQRRLSRIAVNGGNNNSPNSRPRRRRPVRRANQSMAVVAPAIQPPVARAGPSRSRRGKAVSANDGSIRISRGEFLDVVTVQLVKKLTPDSFPWLSALAKAFDRITWHSCTIQYKPAVGTTTNGIVTYGVDWDSDQGRLLDLKMAQALTPLQTHPVWQCSELRLPPPKLQTRKEYKLRAGTDKTDDFDLAPGDLLVWVEGNQGLVGQIWVQYDVTLFGTTVA